MRLLVGDIDELAVTPADLSDLAFEGSPGSVDVTDADGDAVTVAPTTSVSHNRPTNSTSHDLHYDLSGILVPPTDATVRWDSGMAFLSIVSYHYCTLADILDFGDEKRQSPKDLGRTEIDAFRARSTAERVCDDLCGRTFRATRRVDRGARADGRLHQLEWPASRIITPGWESCGDGLCKGPFRSGRGTALDIEYISGIDGGAPSDVRRAVAKLAASYLTISKVPDRAVYESTETGMTRFTLADSDHTGIPDVDAVFARHARMRWAVL